MNMQPMLNKTNTEKLCYNKALDCARAGYFDEADNQLRACLEKHGGDPDLLILFGVVALEAGRIPKAVNRLREAIALFPGNAKLQYHYGLALVRSGDLTGAQEAFRNTLEKDSGFHDARYNLAKLLKENGDLENAIASYRELLARQPRHEEGLYNLANLYYEMDRLPEAVALYTTLLRQNPVHTGALVNLGLIKIRNGQTEQALTLLEKAAQLDPAHPQANRLLRRVYSKSVAAWHFDMLGDDNRNRAYLRAISNAVTKESHVLEIGTGSGLLAMMAARAGARKVTTCEMVGPLARVARRIVEKNGYADRVQVIAKKSTSLRVGEDIDSSADVLIAEVFDNGLLGEHFLPALLHARQNLLTGDAIIVPRAATVHGMLIACPEMRGVNPVKTICGFDLSDFDLFRRDGYKQVDLNVVDHEPLSKPVPICRMDFRSGRLQDKKQTHGLPIEKTGICHALAFWYDLHLDEDTTISTLAPVGTNHWKQAVHFFPRDYPLTAGDVVQLTVNRTKQGLDFTIDAAHQPHADLVGESRGEGVAIQ